MNDQDDISPRYGAAIGWYRLKSKSITSGAHPADEWSVVGVWSIERLPDRQPSNSPER